MSAPQLSSPLFEACLTALRQRRLHEAAAQLAQLDPNSLGAHGAELHAELKRRIAIARQGMAVDAPAADAPQTLALPGRLLEADTGPPLPGISIVGACMNRQGNLLRVLPSWLDSPVDEILIVDWSSDDPLWPMLEGLHDPRLRIVRVEDEPRWILSHAFNVGLRLARHERVYKLDADIQLQPRFLEDNAFGSGEFVRGFWKAAIDAGTLDQMYVNGSFGALKADLREVGYYDERILTYGWDDSDLYMRLSAGMGLAGKLLALGSLRHLDQDDEQRIANQNITRTLRYGKFAPTEHENQVNRFHTASMSEWSKNHWTQDYTLTRDDRSLVTARRLTNRPQYVPGHRVLAETMAARVLVSWTGPLLPADTWPHPDSLELARLARQADRAGCGPRLMDGMRRARNLHLFRVADPVWREALIHTLASMRSHHPMLADSLLIVQDEGFCPESPGEDLPGRGLRAAPALMDVIERVVRPQPRNDLRHLQHEASTVDGPCTRWHIDADSMATRAEVVAEEVDAAIRAHGVSVESVLPGSVLVTSLYDEPNLIRLTEYMACTLLNLRVFEAVVIVYEHRSGLFLQGLQALLGRSGQSLLTRLLLVPSLQRPSFDDLFAQQHRFGEGSLMAVANADVVFDGSLAPLARRLGLDHAAVLSRRELDLNGSVPRLVRTAVGIPNVYSADAWIVRTPFRPDRSFDYGIGSFYCDSFINGQLARSPGLKVSNPCIDTNLFHVHDERFNSSGDKKIKEHEQLEHTYVNESARMADPDPIKGVPWCTAEQLDLALPGGHVMPWTPRTLVVDLAAGPPGLAGLLWLWLLGRQLQWMSPPTRLIARLRQQDAAGPFGLLLARVKNAEGLGQLMLDIAEGPGAKPPVDTAVVELVVADGREWLALLGTSGLDAFVSALAEVLTPPPGVHRQAERRVDLRLPQDTFATQALVDAMERSRVPHWPGLRQLLRDLPTWLAEWRLVSPFGTDLEPTTGWGTARTTAMPQIAFVTSMFRGGAHVPGFLENVSAAAERANGEVVIVDANGSGNDADAEAVERYLADNPHLRHRFRLLRPKSDPGLYACWRLAIEHARAPLITNANLDDRRSPLHSLRLAQLLHERHDLEAVSGALTVVGTDELGGWFDLVPNQVWFGEPGLREFGYDDLFRRAEDGTVFSQNMLHCMPVWRRSLHDRFGWFDEERYGTSADWAFWLHVSRAGARFALDPLAWGRYFFNPSSHNRRNDADGAKERRIIAELIGVHQSRVIKQ